MMTRDQFKRILDVIHTGSKEAGKPAPRGKWETKYYNDILDKIRKQREEIMAEPKDGEANK